MVKFSIIIPTYNRASFITKAIESVLQQEYQDYELIIVDDGSTDGTIEVITPYLSEKIKYFKTENSERGAARNRGIEHSSGDYITFFDSDDLLLPNYLSEANKFILQNTDTEFVHFSYEMQTPSGAVLYTQNKQYKDPNVALLGGNFMSCIGCFIKSDVLDTVQFCEDRKIAASEDWLLWLQLAARVKMRQCSTTTSVMINHENRSVLQFKEEVFLNQMTGVLAVLANDSMFISKFGNKALKKIEARYLSYIALHALMAKEKTTGLNYLMKALIKNLSEIKSRRTLACIKKIILG